MSRLTGFFKKVRFYATILLSRDTPWLVKLLLLVGLAYLIYPLDFITDAIPFLGLLDDLTIGSLLIALALRLIPNHIIERARRKVYKE